MAKSDISTAQTGTKQALGTSQQQGSQYLNQAGAGYGNFAATGGITPGQQQLTREQAQGDVSSIYGSLKQNLERQKAVQGGYSPGFGANEAQLGRQGSAAAANAVNSANLGLDQQIQQGKLAGLQGLQGIGGLYQGQVPGLLNTQAGLAVAKPSWQQEIGSTLGIAGDIGSAISGAFPGSQYLQGLGSL